MFRWFILPKLTLATNDIYVFSIMLTWGETIRLKNLEFITDRYNNESLSPEGNDLGTVFMGMVRNGLPSLHAILEESASEDDSSSSDGGSSSFPIPWDFNMVTLAIPIMTTPLLEGTPMLQIIPLVQQWMTVPKPNTGLLPKQLLAYREEQQHALRADIEHRSMWSHGKLTGEQAAIEALLVELRQHKSTLEVERVMAINREEQHRPTFTRAS
jgi:hypothetical protein